jgi:hypothetical protein
MKKEQNKLNKIMPWLAGAGFAVGHVALSTNCTLPTQGRCTTCGGCIIALGAIVSWAKLNKRRDDFFIGH